MTQHPRIDPKSPVPLYHQIAEAIRTRIEAGELAPGDALEPLRQAAALWNVNLHTVRHAYAALARSGLVERLRGPRGTRVLEVPHEDRPAGDDDGLDAFASRVAREAAGRFGASPGDLAVALRRLGTPAPEAPPCAWIVECSAWQCECHARELTDGYEGDARPWPIDGGQEPPAGAVLSTYFHYNDLRRLWPRRLASVRFLTIYPDPDLAKRLAGVDRVVVAERDASTIEAITADLRALFGERDLEIQPFVDDDPGSRLEREEATAVLFTPRVWASLSETAREHPSAVELRYVFDRAELSRLADELGWVRKRATAARGVR
jgi:DNA-binding transcriptional regulator YhcF (GntR family)